MLHNNIFYDQDLGDSFKVLVQQTKNLRELDLYWCDFRSSMIFYLLMESLERSKVFTFKLRGFQIGKVEGKIL